MGKEYGKLTAEQFKEFIARVPELRHAQRDLQTHLASLSKGRLNLLLTGGYNWGAVYEGTFAEHLALATVSLNLGPLVHEIATSDDPQQQLLDKFDSDPVESIHPAFDAQSVVGLVVSLGKTVASLMTHGRSLSAFVQDVREKGDLDALFEVVRIDRAAVACPSIADRIARAELIGEETFFVKLRNALKGPSKKHWSFDKMRYAMALLREMGIDDLSAAQVEELFVRQLEAYSDVPSAAKNLRAHYLKSRKIKTV